MATNSITSANAVFLLVVSGLFPVPQQIQGFTADDAFAAEPINIAEVVKGIDGRLSAGFVHVLRPMTINLMADSPSGPLFDAWLAAQEAAQEIYWSNAEITLASINSKYVCTKGVLTGIPPMPGVKKTLQARQFTITWESIFRAPM